MPGHRLRTLAIAAPEKEADVYSLPSSSVEVPKGLNKYSSKITQPKSQGASQAMLYATGLSQDDMNKPQVCLPCRLCFSFVGPCSHSSRSQTRCITVIGRPACHVFRHCCLPVMQVGISSVWYEGNPCNMHLNDLAADVKRGVEESGLSALKSITSALSKPVASHSMSIRQARGRCKR